MSGSASRGPAVTIREAAFDDPALPAAWARVLAASNVRPISQTLEWQRTWWATLGRGTLLLLVAERDGEPVAIAPLFHDEGMVFFCGVGEADWHDVLGAGHDPDVLAALLAAAIDRTPGFLGFKLHFIPEHSRTTAALAVAAERLGHDLHEMDSIVSVVVDIAADPDAVRGAVSRSMRKAENFFHKHGGLVVQRLTTAAEVVPLLPEFFEMHLARWRLKGIDSDCVRPDVRAFLERWIEVSAAAGMHTYDLGLGDQAYKFRLPGRTVACPSWGLYPPD